MDLRKALPRVGAAISRRCGSVALDCCLAASKITRSNLGDSVLRPVCRNRANNSAPKKEKLMAIESLGMPGLARAFLVGIAWYASMQVCQDFRAFG